MELEIKLKKGTYKRWLARILVLCLCLGCLGGTSYAKSTTKNTENTDEITKEEKAQVKSFVDDEVTMDMIGNPTVMERNGLYDVSIEESYDVNWFSFVPEKSDVYYFESSYINDDVDPYAALYEEGEEICTLIDYNDDGTYNWNFLFSTYLEEGKTYYLAASCYSSGTGAYQVKVYRPSPLVGITVEEPSAYSPILEYGRKGTSAYENGTITMKYEDGNTESYDCGINTSSVWDRYDNYVTINLKDESQALNWRWKVIGTYQFEATAYNVNDEQIGDTVTFEKEICSFQQYGATATNIEYGKEITVGSGTQIFKVTAKATGNHVIYYTRGLRYSNIYVYNATENRANWKWGNRNTKYGKLTKGNTYYIVVQSYSDDSGRILIDYYNGATNPNAATKVNASSATTTQQSAAAKPATKTSKSIPAKKITVAKKKITLKNGSNIKLSTILSPLNSTDKLSYKSSKPKVVKVSANGKITAKKAGKAKITIKSTSGKSVTVTVTVKKKEVTAKKVSMKKKLQVKAGTVRFLSYKVNPKAATEKMTWKSSKKSVVTVDSNGKIVAKKKGKAKITLKIGSKKATCQIVVK